MLLACMPTFTQRYAGLTPLAGIVVEHDRPDRLVIAIPFMGRAVGQDRPQAAADGVRDRLSDCCAYPLFSLMPPAPVSRS